MKSSSKIILGVLLAALCACSPKPAANPSGAVSDNMAATGADTTGQELDPSAEDNMLENPTPKSEAEIKAVQAVWDDAIAKEKGFFGNERLVKLVDALEETDDEEGIIIGKLDKKQFKDLKCKELVFYTLFHPESWDQICAEFLFDAGLVTGICTHLPFQADYASERQTAAMKAQIDDVQTVVLASIRTNKVVSLPMMHLVVDMDMREAIGPMVDVFRSQTTKDDLILSTFVEMMVNAQYQNWIGSDMYLEMTGKSREWIPMTKANVDALIETATKFAASK